MKINSLKDLIKKIFISHKLRKDHATICAEALINAELVGASSHGKG
jgi:LDH2 family malate/lactate/ureidoglycolate dehydrogenase